MDTSKEYIDMCENAVEVQELWMAKRYDWSCHRGTVSRITAPGEADYTTYIESCQWWLPTQSQLQKLTGLNFIGQCHLYLYRWFNNDYNFPEIQRPVRTMEQLWLVLLMYNRFNKQWNGTDWEEMT